jgi:hypothetical protein
MSPLPNLIGALARGEGRSWRPAKPRHIAGAVEPHATSNLSTPRSSETQRDAQRFGVTDAVPAARLLRRCLMISCESAVIEHKKLRNRCSTN